MIAVSRLFLDNVDNIQSSWVKYGDQQGLKMLSCGANDFMGTILSRRSPNARAASSANTGASTNTSR